MKGTLRFIVVVCALYALTTVLISLKQHRLFIETDSTGYMSLAHNLAHGHGYELYDGDWCPEWPPLFPVCIALFTPLMRDPVGAGALVSALSYAATVIVVGLWMQRRLAWPTVLAGLVLLLVALPIRQMMHSALSEPLFIALSTAFLVACDDYRTRQSRRSMVAMIVLAALSCLTRYTGIVTVGMGLVILLKREGKVSSALAIRVVAFLCASLGPALLWCCLNRVQSGSFTGNRGAPTEKLPEILGHVRMVGILWAGNGQALLLALLLGCMGLQIVGRWKRERLGEAQFWILYATAYLLLMIISAWRTEFDSLDTRLLSPIYIPLALLFLSLADSCLLLPLPKGGRRMLGTALLILLGLFAWHNARQSSDLMDVPFDIASRPIMVYLRNHSDGDTIFSNDPGRCWFGTSSPAESLSSFLPQENDKAIQTTLARASTDNRVVWFVEKDADEDDREEIKARLTACGPLIFVANFPEGLVFRVGQEEEKEDQKGETQKEE